MLQKPIICPFCQNSIIDNLNKSYTCELNHSFDPSKEGYLNLLPIHQKKSKNLGDNEIMIAGKGSYILGTDISKYAIKNAAKKYKDNFYFVSSINHLPIATDSIDILLSIFPQNNPIEFQRVLSKNGIIVIVSPGPNHLKELSELIYDTFRPHENNVAENMETSFKPIFTKETTFNIHITSVENLMVLLKITPYYWSTSEKKLEKFAYCKDITITCDFTITAFKAIEI